MDHTTPSDGTLTLSGPPPEVIEPDPAETRLAQLYRHAPRTVRLGMIESADGLCAGPDGSSRSLNGPEDLRILRTLRSQADVVLVGAQTARRERYRSIELSKDLQRTRRLADLRPSVDLAIVSRSGNLPPGLNPLTTWVVTTVGSAASRRLDPTWQPRIIFAGSDDIAPRTVVRELFQRGLSRVLCEGGPTLARELLTRDLVDDYCLTTSPETGGGGQPQTPPVPTGFTASHELVGGGFTIRRWRRQS